MLRLILIVVLLLLLIGSLPTWGLTTGYYPSGGLGLILIVVVILIVMDRI